MLMVEEEPSHVKPVLYSYPMIRYTDMEDNMKKEVMEVCTSACEKHTANNELCAKMIKEILDKKFGASWHVVVGEGFGFELSYECAYEYGRGHIDCDHSSDSDDDKPETTGTKNNVNVILCNH